MSVGLPSDEVAEDYKNSLEDLTMNSRYEISNLTVIAKENTEHGMAISRVLENHIRNTPPDRKLPALYVLDSIVKNVGTPYTLFLGRNLYQTFMNAYSLVNNNQVRKKLDEMLKTWKEPVPGSLDPRPVFPVETTRPIENALIKARTLAVQQQQQQAKTHQEMLSRSRPTATPPSTWRNTPTPPQAVGRYPPPSAQSYSQHNLQNGHVQAHSAYQAFRQYPTPQAPSSFQSNFQPPTSYQPPPPPPQTNLDSLHRDIGNLITAARSEFAATPWELAIRQRLKALLDLQTILKNQQLPPDQIQLIQNQVAQLSASARPATVAPTPASAPVSVSVPPPSIPLPLPPKPQSDLQALLSSNALADILASATKVPQVSQTTSVPHIPFGQASVPSSQPSIIATSTSAGSQSSLIASLRAAGMLPPTATMPINGALNASQPLFQYSTSQPTIHTPPTQPINPAQPSSLERHNNVQLTSASLKIPRPHLISTLYEALPNQCSTCGRRFLATEEGRRKKARHLDWHFRTNQRLADSARRGQSRSWFLDELEWIKSRENNEEEALDSPDGTEAPKALAAAIAAKNNPMNKYIPVPNDSTLANAPCPICQEKFETSWNEEAQDFVWMDAIQIGARVYHASCHDEIKKAGGNTPLRTSTPESVLGKRKATGVSIREHPDEKKVKRVR